MEMRRRELLERVTLAELEAFVAVARLGGFTSAAEWLHLTQPATTSRVQRLESAVGVQLFTRSTRKVALSPTGERLLASLEPLLDELDSTLRCPGVPPDRHVVVASTPYLAIAMLFPLVQEFTAESGIRVTVLDLDYPDVLRSLETGEADVAVLSEHGDGRFPAEYLGSDEVVLVLPPGHVMTGRGEITPTELAALELTLIRPYKHIFSELADAARAATGTVPVIRWVGSLTTLQGLLETDTGLVGAMTRDTARRFKIAEESILRISGVDIRRYYNLFRSARPSTGSAVLQFIRHARETIRRPGNAMGLS